MKLACQLLLLLWVGVFFPGGDTKAGPPAGQSPPPPPEVSVVNVHMSSVPLTRDTVGRLAATRVAQVRARVAGIILKRVYAEGTDVQPGKVLFQIDPAPLEAALHVAQASLAKAEADATNAALTAKRYVELRTKNLLAQQDLDTALANERTTAAVVKQAQANVEIARLNLGYATVTAPIAGRAGRARVTEGTLVGQGDTTELTTIEQIDPIYVNFSQSIAELAQLQDAATQSREAPKRKIEILLPDGASYQHTGTLDFSDLAVIPSTGTISLRGILPNPEYRLLPGMFVSVRLTAGVLEHAFLLPHAAIQRDNTGAYALVVNKVGKVEQRRLETHFMTRTDWAVTGKLVDDDQVIVEGLQKVRPGADANALLLNNKGNK
ncbi:Multidrug export protein AcrE [Gammaproteobacteria bacterium]